MQSLERFRDSLLSGGLQVAVVMRSADAQPFG